MDLKHTDSVFLEYKGLSLAAGATTSAALSTRMSSQTVKEEQGALGRKKREWSKEGNQRTLLKQPNAVLISGCFRNTEWMNEWMKCWPWGPGCKSRQESTDGLWEQALNIFLFLKPRFQFLPLQFFQVSACLFLLIYRPFSHYLRHI